MESAGPDAHPPGGGPAPAVPPDGVATVAGTPGGDDPGLTIGEVSERTGVTVPTLRMWESRHGFPVPRRLENGHRRYTAADVDAVAAVLRRRAAGTRLETAISLTRTPVAAASASVFATLRRSHPDLEVHTLRKSTLLAISWAVEDQFAALAEDAVLYAGFQREQHYRASEARWKELATVATYATVFADFPSPAPERHPREVAVPRSVPLAREWAVVCHAPTLPVVLTAWELPGQSGVPDGDRLFEAIWTVEGHAVHDAAQVCLRVSREHGGEVSEAERAAVEQVPDAVDPRVVTALYSRIVAYVDRRQRGPA